MIILLVPASLITGLPVLEAQVKEPYAPLHGGSFSAPEVPQSPDPLVTYHWWNPRLADSLQIYTLQPILVRGPKSFDIPPVDRINTEGITVRGTGDLFLDFGVESAAWLEFESDDLQDTVEMSVSEYNEPAIVNEGAQHPVKTAVPVKYGHVYRLELNDQLYEGVRFGWIHVKRFTKPWHIKKLRLVCQIRPTNYNGSFWCNDTLLNRIWYTGAYVVKLNLLKDYFGAILVERSDRQSWTGDAYPAQAAALVAFGNEDMIKKNLTLTSTQDDNGIPAYSLYWVLSLIDYFDYAGDTVFFNRLVANADRRLTHAYAHYDSLPNLSFMGWDERLGGFEDPNTPEAEYTYRMLCIKTWNWFAQTLRKTGNPENSRLADKYERYAESKAAQIPDQVLSRFDVHALSEALNGRVIGKARLYGYASRLFSDRINRLSHSPFNQYFIIQGMAAAGFYRDAIDAIRDYWGGQIHYGATCFFEMYRPDWNNILRPNDPVPNGQCGYTSLAHPWGAGVTKWLTEEVLGIKPLEPGFRTVSIVPHLVSGITQVRGKVPAPNGLIRASFNSITGEDTVSIPAGTQASRIGIPKAGRKIKTIRLNGELVYRSGKSLLKDRGQMQEDSEFVYLTDLKAGACFIKAGYENRSRRAEPVVRGDQEDSWKFSVMHFSEDSTTSGRWPGHYGKDGYVFFNYTSRGNLSQLPDYIKSVRTGRNGVVVWDSTAADGRALNIGSNHKATAIITRDPIATMQTMTIDVTVKDTLEHTLSLYFVDYNRRHRRTAVELFRLDNLDLIAPIQMVRHYEGGKYLRFSCKGSVRIRIDQVRGENAAVSGLFFD